MKHLVVLLAACSLASAQGFINGQAARVVIGQPTFTSQDPGASKRLLGAASGLAYANGMLFVADANRVSAAPQNHRVLIYRDVTKLFPQPLEEVPQGDFNRCPLCLGRNDLPYGEADLVLGQPDFTKTDFSRTRTGLRLPTAIATDGTRLVVADTENNRVLIWNSIPTSNNAPADVVLGAPDFTTLRAGILDSKSFRGPQGVWIQGTRLFVADTQNHRVMVWNRIPTANDQAADYVLGQKDFNTTSERDIGQTQTPPAANRLLNPVSVTSDGTRLFVTDLGYNRVVIWNSIPTQNEQPADVVLGQKDFTKGNANDSAANCAPTGKNADGQDTFPLRCEFTMNFPRFALSDGKQLFVADGGNDRILIWSTIPTENGKAPDRVIGQPDFLTDVITDNEDFFTPNLLKGAPSTTRTPLSLAWDGTNLYVSNPFDRRVVVFTVGQQSVLYNGIRNAASRNVYAVGVMEFGGTIKENDEVTIKIAAREYKYKVLKDDTPANIIRKVADLINAGDGDPDVLAIPNATVGNVLLTARQPGEVGNNIDVTTTLSDAATLTVTGGKPAGGGDATRVAPGGLVTFFGENLSDETAAVPDGTQVLPKELGNVQVYMDGIRVPIMSVSPTEVTAQIPFDFFDSNGVSSYIRTKRRNGSVTITAAVNMPVTVRGNPGIFASDGPDPRPGIVLHGSSYAQGTIFVEGLAKENDEAIIRIDDREYRYKVLKDETNTRVRDALIELINNNPEEIVVASAGGSFNRVRLRAKVEGPEGNNIRIVGTQNDGAGVAMGAFQPQLCCANKAGERVTEANPATPGEQIIVYATGLGIVRPDAARESATVGLAFPGPELNDPLESVSSLAGARSANVISAGLKPGTIGLYEVILELNSDLPTNPKTQLTIAQYIYTSNIVTFPVKRSN